MHYLLRVLLCATALLFCVLASAGNLPSCRAAETTAPDKVEQFVPGTSHTTPLFDEQTLRKKWVAAENLAGPVEPVRPAVRKKFKLTGELKPPVPAVTSTPGKPVFKLDFGELPISAYAVRVVAMVSSEYIEQYRKPLYLELRVNDKVGGGQSIYRHRVPYWDDFFSVTEFYFNVDERRPYSATLTVGEGSIVPLSIHSIEFHDTLAGLPHEAAKKKPGLFTLAERAQLRQTADPKETWATVSKNTPLGGIHMQGAEPLSPEARQTRDEQLWNAFPPLNSQFLQEYDDGFAINSQRAGTLSPAEVAKQHGTWEWSSYWKAWDQPLTLENKKLNLRYTREDFENHRPLPEPYPYQDRGGGVYFPQAAGMEHGEHFMPIAENLGLRWEAIRLPLAAYHGYAGTPRLPDLYHALENENAARDAAFMLARWAWTYPTFTDAQTLGYAVISPASIYNRDSRLMGRAHMFYTVSGRGATLLQDLSRSYDLLFDYIKGNQELAQAVGRFIPWIKNDEDLRRLIETRILQFGAKQTMRFHILNDKEHPLFLLHLAVVQQDPEVTRPWMEFLWSKTWIYPHPRAGLPDYISTTTQRDGTTDIGSVFYTWQGSPFLDAALLSRRYVQNGGDAKYDLTDFQKYFKLSQAPLFPLASAVAGGFPMTIGDVGDPAKPRLLDNLSIFEETFRTGYKINRDPRLAWIIAHHFQRRSETDEEWKALQADAQRQGRNPFLDQQSRVLANWAGIIESGQESDDFRDKRTAYMRVGTGHGHAHADTLDLQVMAHGVRAVNDVGWRGSYSAPKTTKSQLHNLVEVGEEHDWQSHSWISTFAPARGAQFMRGAATPQSSNSGLLTRSRDVALLDVDDRNSYVFSVERVTGSDVHTFAFHGTVSDDFQVNLQKTTTSLPEAEANYLRRFLSGGTYQGKPLKYAGDTPEVLQATWRLRRAEETIEALDRDGKKVSLPQQNAEALTQGEDYDPTSPRKYTRLYLFGHGGERGMVSHLDPHEENVTMTWPFLFVQRHGANLQSVFPSIIEPYAGEPFITSTRSLPIADNETDAQRAVALEVKTKNGHTDMLFSDGRNKERRIGDYTVKGRFAYVSSDANGLRLAHLVEGSTLATPWGTLSVEKAEYSGKITKIDYWQRKVWLGGAWPEPKKLIGRQIEFGNDSPSTSYTVVDATREGEHTILTLDKSLDLSYAHVAKVDVANKRITTNVGPVTSHYGGYEGLTCTNDDRSKSWKCSVVKADGGQLIYQLEGEFTENDLPVGSVFRLWEMGAGDDARLATSAVVRRGRNGEYSVESNGNALWK